MTNLENTPSEDTTSLPTAYRGQTVSGRVFTRLLVLVLAVTLLGGLPIVLRFQHLQSLGDQANQTWPAAATRLGEFYRATFTKLEAAVEPPPNPERQELMNRLKMGLEEFDKRSGRTEQLPAAQQIDQVLEAPELARIWRADESLRNLRRSIAESTEVVRYLADEDQLVAAEGGWLGQLTRSALLLKKAPTLQPE